MAYEGKQICLPGLVSGGDLSAAACAFKFVRFTTAPAVDLCSNIAHVPIGVLQAPAPTSANGHPVQVVALGVTKLQGDGVITVGDNVSCDANGRGVACVWGTNKTTFVAGQIISEAATGTAGLLHTAIINCINPPKAVTSQ